MISLVLAYLFLNGIKRFPNNLSSGALKHSAKEKACMPRTKSKRPCRRQRELQPHATPVPAVGCRDNALILVEILRPFQAIISVMNVEGSLRQSACSERVSRPSPQALPRCAHACARPFTRHLPAGLLAVAGDQAIAGRQTALAEMTSQRKRCH